jgi:hypothetical protein
MRFIPFVVAAALLLPGTAGAQWRNPFTGNTFNNPISSSLDTMILHSMQQRMLQQSIQAHQQGTAKAAKPKHVPLSKTDFKPPEKGHPVVKAFLDAAAPKADERKQFQKAIDETFGVVEKSLRKNNVATAFGLAIGTALEIVTGKESSEQADKELIAGINDELAAAPEFAKLAPKDKQTLNDTLVLTGALMIILHTAGQSDPAMKDASVSLAKAVLTQLTGSATASP